jgi:hypothetical protein
VIDIDLKSLIGEEFPKLTRYAGRKLQSKKHSPRKTYNRFVRSNFLRHRIPQKYDYLRSNHHSLSEQEKQLAIDKLDKQKTEIMLGGEKGCRKIMKGTIENSPKVGMWLKRERVFNWMLKHKLSPLKDPRNLHRACRVLSKAGGAMTVKLPKYYTVDEVRANIIAIGEQINRLHGQAPELRLQHLRSCLADAEEKGQTRRANDIVQIISREAVQGSYEEINKTTRDRKGGGKVFKVERRELDGTTSVFNTKEAIEQVAGQTIGERYRLAYSAPMMVNPTLLRDVGFAGDGDAIESILRGTYDFPSGTDDYTQLLLLEAAVLFCSLGEEEIRDLVEREDFQDFWRTTREATESSFSRCHFGHYVSASHDSVISDVHVLSLNTIREMGVSPQRWRNSITVLLEKVFGNRFIDKLRAICLLEADFNWYNKLIFAHRLEQFCRKHDIIPHEQFAKSKLSCEEATLVKNTVCDTARIMHNSFIISGADLDQCFDRSNAPIAGLSARAHHISKASTSLMLRTMQNMQYFVRAGFGISEEPAFGGSKGDLLMSLGQGSGAAPMGMRNIITLADNAYKRLGHGINLESAISLRIFLLAAIIYVDDTDLLHWGSFYGISDEDFLAEAQTATIDWGMLIQATGGAIKPAKSFWYLLSWKFPRGRPVLKQKREYNSLRLVSIPQPNSHPVPIRLLDNLHTEKTLGVWSNPLNAPTVPLSKLHDKGTTWVDKLCRRPLERRDAWLSLTTQEYPKWSYGLSSLYATPEELDSVMGSIYFKALPFLGFNRNITTEFRTLPSQYQGIGLRHWPLATGPLRNCPRT